MKNGRASPRSAPICVPVRGIARGGNHARYRAASPALSAAFSSGFAPARGTGLLSLKLLEQEHAQEHGGDENENGRPARYG